MLLVSALRDYIDLINSSFDSVSANTGINQLLVPTLLYFIGSFKHVAVYLLSFQWLRDLVQLPLLVPRLSLSILKGDCYPLENPVLNFFTFLEEPAYNENRLLIGFLNSLFASLPVTAAHVIAGRRLLVQGIPAGVAAGSGIVLGQWWFLTCVTLGLRSFLLPWLSLEPLNYLLGLALLIGSVYRIAHQRRIRTPKWTDRGELLQYFVMSFLLTWCEQTTIFQYLGNLTVGAGSTALEGFSSNRGGLSDWFPIWELSVCIPVWLLSLRSSKSLGVGVVNNIFSTDESNASSISCAPYRLQLDLSSILWHRLPAY